MKYRFIIFLLVPFFAHSQTTNKNYILKTIFKDENNQSPEKTIEYYDAFGRNEETIMYKQGADNSDLVSFMRYDEYGNEIKRYLPYSDIYGSSLNSRGYYNEIDSRDYFGEYYNEYEDYFVEYEIEKSPLRRIKKLAHPGKIWKMGSGREIKTEFEFNSLNDSVVKYIINSNYDGSNNIFLNTFTYNNLYNNNKLYKKIVKNENWTVVDNKNNTKEYYTDSSGKIILERNYNEGKKHDTYYLYDKFGNLVFILPPNVKHKNISTDEIENLIYQYRYDQKDRVVERKKPNRGWESIVYDKQDRVVLEQNILQKNKEWVFKKYDNLNRLVYSGTFRNTSDRSVMQTAINNMRQNPFNNENRSSVPFTNNSNNIYYENNAFPNGSLTIDKVNYYDHYNSSETIPTTNIYGHSILNDADRTKGLLVASHINVIGTNKWNKDVFYYENKYMHLVALNKKLFSGGEESEAYKVDFLGNIEKSNIRQKVTTSSSFINVVTKYFYTPNFLLEKVTQRIDDNAEELLFDQKLNPFGKVIVKKIGGSDLSANDYLQKIDFKYNIRGWLTDINDVEDIITDNDVFSLKINRETTGTNYNLYDGNISSVFWRSKKDNVLKKYLYEYDDLNRLVEGGYFTQKSTLGGVKISIKTGAFKEKLTYDKIGNIASLIRTGDIINNNVIEIDDLSYSYEGNNLIKIIDATNNSDGFSGENQTEVDYVYDLNGNLIVDRNKEIEEIKYNYLNLPSEVNKGSNKIKYYYTSDGKKVEKVLETPSNTTSTLFINNFEYINEDFSILKHSDGYVMKNGENYNYVYTFKDHLGNNRISFQDKNGNNTIEFNEISDEYVYYPFGLIHEGDNNNLYRYKYQGMEKESDLEIGWYNFKYRTYSPEIGRFLSIDPLADKYVTNSPFAFSENRVIEAIDLEGTEAWYNFDGSLSNISGPVSIDYRQKNKLYSPSDIAALNTIRKNTKTDIKINQQPTFEPGISEAQAKRNRQRVLQKEFARQRLINYTNLGSPYAAYNVMEGAAYGGVDLISGFIIDDLFKGAHHYMKYKNVKTFNSNFSPNYVSNPSLIKDLGVKVTSIGPLNTTTGLPNYYTISVASQEFYITPHTAKHLIELFKNARSKGLGNNYIELLSQTHMKALISTAKEALDQTGGTIRYNHMYNINGHEIMFGPPREGGELPAIIHFR